MKYLISIVLFLISFSVKSQIYTPESGRQITHLKLDSSLLVPFRDTVFGRATVRPGALVCRPADSLVYYYTGRKWALLKQDSTGLTALINNKVDSLTLSSNILFYHINGTSTGLTLPIGTDSAFTRITAPNDSTLRFFRFNGDSVEVATSTATGGGGTTDTTGYMVKIHQGYGSLITGTSPIRLITIDTINIATRNYAKKVADSLSISKVKYSDTASMLTNYINAVDTSSMLTNYRHWLAGYTKNSDTSAMLTNYRHWLQGYIKSSDTAAMLSPYVNGTDTIGMRTKVFGNYGDVQLYRFGLNTPAGDSLIYKSDSLKVKGTIYATGRGTFNDLVVSPVGAAGYFKVDNVGKITRLGGDSVLITSAPFNSLSIPYFSDEGIYVKSLVGPQQGHKMLSDGGLTGQTYLSAATNDGTQVAHIFNTNANLISGNKLATFKNNGTEKAYIDYNGNTNLGGTLTVGSIASGTSTDSVVTITSGGLIRKRNASAFGGGGGSTDTTNYMIRLYNAWGITQTGTFPTKIISVDSFNVASRAYAIKVADSMASLRPTPTLQQVLTAGSTLSTNNSINVNGSDYSIINSRITTNTATLLNVLGTYTGTSYFSAAEALQYRAGLRTVNYSATNGSYLYVYKDSIMLQPQFGNLYIDSLNHSLTDTDKMLVWDSAAKKVATRLIPSGGAATDTTNYALRLFSGYGINQTGTFPTKTISVDTAGMATRLRVQKAIDSLGLLKLNISDTATMQANDRAMIFQRVKYSDTASMLANYQTQIFQRVKYSDTASMLSPYINSTDTVGLKPRVIAGTNITITGTYPNQIINASGGSASAGGSNTQVQYNSGGALAGITGATSNGTTMTLTSPVINNIAGNYTTTVTAAGTTTLTNTSTYTQNFTGSTTQTVVLPDATTMTVGMGFYITNPSTGVLTVNKNGGGLLFTVAAGQTLSVTVTDVSTSAGTWATEYTGNIAVLNAANTFTDKITTATGTTSIVPINIPVGVAQTSPASGDITRPASGVFTAATTATENGILPSEQYSVVGSDFTLSAALGVQSAFPTTGDVWTLAGSTLYEVEGNYIMTTGTTTTKTTAIAFALGGGASVNYVGLNVQGWNGVPGTTATAQGTLAMTGVASAVVTATATTAGVQIYFKGIISMNAGGTVTPQINFSANPGGTNLMKAGSYIKFKKLGANTFTTIGAVN